MRLLRWNLVALLLLAASCVYVKPQDPVLVASEPAGAHIFLDGEDTGRTTPACFDLGGDHLLELRKSGYRSERRWLTQYTASYFSRWIDGTSGPDCPPMPIFWTFGDVFMPIGIRSAIVPGELYVRLYRTSDPLLGFDVLAQKAQRNPQPTPLK